MGKLLLSLCVMACLTPSLHAADNDAERWSKDLSPEARAALKDLSSEDFNDRAKAVKHLEAAFANQAFALASGTEGDEQADAGLVESLSFNDGLTRWVIEVLKGPAEGRAEQLSLFNHPETFPVLSKLFDTNVIQRQAGVEALAKLDLPGVDALLARMIDDVERPVLVAAMDGVWDRKPSKLVVDALWRRAVESAMGRSVIDPNAPRPVVMFRGRPVQGGYDYGGAYAHSMDGELAVDVMEHYNSPLVKDRLVDFFKRAGEIAARPDVKDGELSRLAIYSQPIKNAYQLLGRYKPAETISSLVALATCRGVNKSIYGGPNGKSYVTNRVAPLAMVVAMTGQDPKDYHLKEMDQGEMGKLAACEIEDNVPVQKLRDWWESVGKKQFGSASSSPDKTAMAPG